MKRGKKTFTQVALGLTLALSAMILGPLAPSPAGAADQVSPAAAAQQLKAKTAAGATVLEPNALGDFSRDNVFTAVTLCRIVDTRAAGGILQANVTRTFDVDGSNFSSQGGSSTGCGIPSGVAAAVAMVIHVVTPTGGGSLVAWGLGTKPTATVMNFVNGQTIATTTIVPVVPGAGNDFSISASVNTHVAIDVVGYFSAPIATALDCINVASASTSVPFNVYTAVDALCPAGRTVTGGGTFPVEGTLGRPQIWTDGSPTAANGWRTWVDNQTGGVRHVQTYAVCCRIRGR